MVHKVQMKTLYAKKMGYNSLLENKGREVEEFLFNFTLNKTVLLWAVPCIVIWLNKCISMYEVHSRLQKLFEALQKNEISLRLMRAS